MSTTPLPPDENLPPTPPDNPDASDPSKKIESDGDKGTALPQKLVDLVKSFPKEQRAEIISNLLEQVEVGSMSMARMMHFSGPYPHPDILRGIEEVVPGAAAEIIEMAHAQSNHRREIEKIAIKSQLSQSGLGQWLGFIIAILGLGGAIYLVANGHDAAGATIGGIDLVGLVSIFVIGRNNQKKDLNKRKDE